MPRLLPQSEDAERHVLGACLQSPKALTEALLELRTHHFYVNRCATVFEAMATIASRDEPVDMVTVMRELDASHKFEARAAWQGNIESQKAEMTCFLAELVAETPTTDHVKRHAKIVKEMWGKRRLIEVFTPPMTNVWNGARPDDVLKAVEKAVLTARTEIEDEGESRVVSVFDAAEWIQGRVKNPPDKRAGIGTPFGFLPRFQPGRLYVLGGYPKDGKTAAMVQFLKAGAEDGKRVGVCTVEMSWEDITTRIVSTYGVPYGPLQDGIVAPAHQESFERALTSLAKMDIDLIDDAAITASDIARYQRIGRYDYILIDYLQRMPYSDRFELNAQIKGITTLARKAEIPILLLSQFSRPQNTSPGKPFPRPNMSQFAETSVIEKEAAMAMAIWRPRDEHGEPGEAAEFIVMASRYTSPTFRKLHFRGHEQYFAEVAFG